MGVLTKREKLAADIEKRLAELETSAEWVSSSIVVAIVVDLSSRRRKRRRWWP
jgi:hypothetical protein